MMDPTVDMMGSRDLDSRLTSREAAAVADWLDTGQCCLFGAVQFLYNL